MNFKLKSKCKCKLQTKIMLLVFSVVTVALLVSNVLISRSIEVEIKDGIGRQAMSIAHLIARSSIVVEGLEKGQYSESMQTYTSESAKATDVEYIVILNMQGVRQAHPNKSKVGERFVGGDEAEALAGQEYTSIARGTLGDSLRAFVPVVGKDGQQIGVVVVGILMDHIKFLVMQISKVLLVAIGIGMVLGIMGIIEVVLTPRILESVLGKNKK